MARTESSLLHPRAGYQLSGTFLDACQCGILCPCWVGEDPDEGEHHAINAYHVDAGHIGGVDVTGLNVIDVVFVPGNVFMPGTWTVLRLIDARAGDEQRAALLRLFRGELGGPMAGMATFVGEEAGAETVPISHAVSSGAGTVSVPGILEAVIEPYRGPDGSVTTLRDSIFSTVPGSPAFVCKASRHWVDLPRYGMVWEYRQRNAIHAEWTVEHTGRAAVAASDETAGP